MNGTTAEKNGRSGRVACIVLAAGLASRMGRCKALLPLGDRPVLAHVLDHALACTELDTCVLVLGYCAGEIKQALTQEYTDRIIVVENQTYASGMAGSIRCGLNRLHQMNQTEAPYTAALFILGDQPLVPAGVFSTLAKASADRPGKILIPTFRGRKGTPVLFDRRFFPELAAMSGDTGGRALFRRHPDALSHIPVQAPGICHDLDTPEDYQTLIRDESRQK